MHFVHIAFVSLSLFLLTEVFAEQPPPFLSTLFLSTRSVVYAKEREATSSDISPDVLLAWPFELSVGSLNQLVAEDDVDANQPTSTPTALPTPVSITATPSITPTMLHTEPDVVLNPAHDQASTLPLSGLAMYYNPDVMREVVSNRMAMGHLSACSECIGQVALLRVGDLNRRVWLQWADGKVEGPFLVADVAASHHVDQLLARNWVVDVDYQTALRRGMSGPVPVTVLAAPSVTAPHFAGVATPEVSILSATSSATPQPTMTPQPLAEATPTPMQLALFATSVPTALPFPYETSQPQEVVDSAHNAAVEQVASDQQLTPTEPSVPATSTLTPTPIPTVQPAQPLASATPEVLPTVKELVVTDAMTPTVQPVLPKATTQWVPLTPDATSTMEVLINGMTVTPTSLPYPYEKDSEK